MPDNDQESFPFEPDWVSIPGDSVRDLLEALSIEEATVPSYLGLDPSVVKALFEGWLVFDETLAGMLAEKLGSSQQFWLNLDHNYRTGLVNLNPLGHFAAPHELLRLLTARFPPMSGHHALLLHPERPEGLLLLMRLGGTGVPIELEKSDLGKHPRLLADEISTMLVLNPESRALLGGKALPPSPLPT